MALPFQFRHVNRLEYPRKRVLVVEDDLSCQRRAVELFDRLFGPQGPVQLTLADGGLAASSVLTYAKVDLILLDHDMPEGNAEDLIAWMKTNATWGTPIITFSGIDANNDRMAAAGAQHKMSKEQVLGGAADALILKILGLKSALPQGEAMPTMMVQAQPQQSKSPWDGAWT